MTAAVQGHTLEAFQLTDLAPRVDVSVQAPVSTKHDVHTTLNYHKDNEDGSPIPPAYVSRPETFKRPMETHDVVIRDILGDEDSFSLDGAGFQIHRHTSSVKDFWDVDVITTAYYAETARLLSNV